MIDQTVHLDPTYSCSSDFAEALRELLENHNWDFYSAPRVRKFDNKVVIEHVFGYLVFLPESPALLNVVYNSGLKMVQEARCASM